MATQNSTNRKRTIQITSAIIGCGVLAAAIGAFTARHSIIDWYRTSQAEPVPVAVSFTEVVNSEPEESTTTTTPTTSNATTEATNDGTTETEPEIETPEPEIVPPAELNLAIPFTSQAPQANWDLPYQEACEEASVLMTARFLQGRSITGPDDANTAIVELVNYNVEELGQPIDSTAQETANLIEDFYDLQAEVLYDWSWDDVKQALTQGYPVIFPAAGRELGNPNFTAPGPIYHMLVIKGYTESIVITNDPGTRKGADYQYSYDTLAKANHDWNGGDVGNGDKVIIIVRPADEN